jgi:hypothetical protein
MPIEEIDDGENSIAITGTATGTNALGIYGKGDAVGVRGDGIGWHGVVGFSQGGFGVYGEGLTGGTGVVGKSTRWRAVGGFSESTTGGAGVYAEGIGPGVIGVSKTWHGVYGETPSDTGGAGVWGEHKGGGSGVVGVSQSGAGVYGKGGRVAAFFEGDVEITGDLRLTNADCAEDFDIADAHLVEPGTVMVLRDDGVLEPSQIPYDKRVAGVISGAGDYKPAIVLDKQGSRPNRKAVALLGKAYCKVDANFGAVEMGDLLTTSPSLGHAMKATDQLKAFGAVIGKAMRPLASGQGLIPILIALR